MAGPPAADVTGLLLRWSQGEGEAFEQLLPLVYGECRRIAERQLRRERPDHTLSPTALVHELYLRLVNQDRATWQNRAQFFGVAAQLMRRILVDHARSRLAQKRGGSRMFISLDAAVDSPADARVADVLALHEALDRLAARDPEQERLVELRFFAGLTVEETAHVLGRSPRTVKREWQLAKAWLFRELHPDR
ncbi:MAG: sigma-70 family RNA polymerase sigma factor [Actinobacteria bacterium]|nr:sigma-70 family RNA polymerase sigma factor [Actinomycetota bacterium]